MKNNFAVIGLEDGSVGLVYIRYLSEDQLNCIHSSKKSFIGQSPMNFVSSLGDQDDVKHLIALACVNAISQSYIRQKKIQLDFTSDSLGALNPQSSDKIGMVGFFKGLIPQITSSGATLTVIEKRTDLVQEHSKWHVTNDPKELKDCNKVLCTASTLINKTIENILEYTQKSTFFTIIGPTAGMLPDELFKRGITVVAGTFVHDSDLLFDCVQNEKDWAPAVHKYCILKNTYPN